MEKLRLLDLFSGIGGFSLGLERSEFFETVAFCEIDPFCRRVLAKHWPKVPCYDDVRTLTGERLAADGIAVDAICGGFPCQDISSAGKGKGLAGERSGLWFEYARLVGEIRPRFVIVENVAELLGRGLGDVLGTLASLGYDAEWHCVPASELGSPHTRDRVWVIANPNSCAVRAPRQIQAQGASAGFLNRAFVANAFVEDWGSIVSDVGSAVYGFPGVVDALRPLGNAVVPQIPEMIGRAIGAAMEPAQ